jgi:hypothetical protein
MKCNTEKEPLSSSCYSQACAKAASSESNYAQIRQGYIIGFISLFWLLLKTGRKPTRIQYPCQQIALTNIGIFLIPAFALLAFKWLSWLRHRTCSKQFLRVCVGAIILILTIASAWGLWNAYSSHHTQRYYQDLRLKGPFGKTAPATFGTVSALNFLTVPHASALPSAHRVVSVHDPNATSWTFPCTSYGPCAEYYGDDKFVNQAVVDQMFSSGMKALTGEYSISKAWRAIFPDYQAGEVVAIKVNFNDSIVGGGISGYGDNDAFLDALPQVINSIIDGLTSFGVPEENIWIFDASRYITDRFRTRIAYSSVRFFDKTGNGNDVAPATFDSPDPSALIEFNNTTYRGSHRIADILMDADYIINVPIMKRHGGAGVTLSLKNHMGSVNGFYTGGHSMHDYIYLNNGSYDADSNPLVDINLNTNIMDKTVLIIGDALYAGWSSNNTPPERWASFNNDSPNMLFFSADPVAIDSVMFDYLDREGYVNPKSEDILIVAANAGLGVHERWNNDTDRNYSVIDYVEIEGSGSETNGSNGAIGARFLLLF